MSNLDYFSKISRYATNVHAISSMFQKWGYSPVLIPLVDHEKFYKQDFHLKQYTIKTLNERNELMLLRSDSTVFLSKILGSHIQKKVLPLRLYYSNSVFQSSILHEVEQWQSGVELIGVASPTAEFEILSLLYSLMTSLIDDFRIHISSRSLLIELLHHNSTSILEQEYHDILILIRSQNKAALDKKLDTNVIKSIFHIADAKEYVLWKKNIVSILGKSNIQLEFFTKFFEPLLEIDTQNKIRCDLSEISHHSYYTNTVFTLFTPTLAFPLAIGGRYDSLLKEYGYNTPAIGFSLYPHLIVKDLIHKSKHTIKAMENPFQVLYNEKSPSKKKLIACLKKLK